MADISWVKLVWETGPTYFNDRAVFLVLVDCASANGHRAWPSVATIAHRVGISERRARDRLRALEADGWITTESPGGGRHRSTVYAVNVGRLVAGNPDETRTERPQKKPGRNPDAVTRNPDAASENPDGASAQRLRTLKEREGARAAADDPLPGVLTQAPHPCSKHPNGWHHDEPCRRCMALRVYDDNQRAAAARLPVHHATPPEKLAAVDTASHVASARAELRAAKKPHDAAPADIPPRADVPKVNGRASGAAARKRLPDPVPLDPFSDEWFDALEARNGISYAPTSRKQLRTS